MITPVGIDPGKNGAWCMIGCREIWWGRGIESFQSLTHVSSYIYLEKVGASPQMGTTSAFSFGVEFGKWLGVLVGMQLEPTLIAPQIWTHWLRKNNYREVLDGTAGEARKQVLKGIAQELYPRVNITLTNCDAFLIALYGVFQIPGISQNVVNSVQSLTAKEIKKP